MADIDQGIIDRIVSGDTTLKDLNVLKGMFGPNETVSLRKEFVAILGKNLSDDALHKFNSKVMEHSVELAVDPDTKFMYRTPEMKFFQEMLVLEARREGMRVELGPNGITENNMLSVIPPKIMEHYATLSKHLHQTHKNESNALMAEVISWGLTASLARESENYKKADKATQGLTELVIAKETEKTKNSLNNIKILDQIKAAAIAEPTVVKSEKAQVELTTKTIIDSYKATQKSLEIIRKSLDSLGPTVRTSHVGKEVERALLESMKQIPNETLQNNEARAVKFLQNKLQKMTKKKTLIVSDKELHLITEEFIAQCSGNAQKQPTTNQQITEKFTEFTDKILSTLKNLQGYASKVIDRFRTGKKVFDKAKAALPGEVLGKVEKAEVRELGIELQEYIPTQAKRRNSSSTDLGTANKETTSKEKGSLGKTEKARGVITKGRVTALTKKMEEAHHQYGRPPSRLSRKDQSPSKMRS